METARCVEKTCCPVVLFDGGIPPVYMTKKAACADLAVPEKVVIPPHSAVRVGLKVGFEIPDGMKIIMYPRSSLLVKRGLFQPTSIIEPDYNGQEVHAPLFNGTDTEVVLEAGDRVSQIECVPRWDCYSWDHKKAERSKSDGGFGSTGK